ncbi:MAG: cobalamin-dependent protein [Planctomycetota bacterium]
MPEPLLMRYMQPLLAGRRSECFSVVNNAARTGIPAEELICDVILPAMAQVDRLYRDDRINIATEHMACRINRTLADQLQVYLPEQSRIGKRAIIACAAGEQEELGAEVVGDLLQADGWDIFFLGGGVPIDEILSLVGQLRPDVLLIFGTQPEGVPETRRLVELIRDVGVCPTMNIVVSGGIYNRADGLWQEVGADLYSESVRELRSILYDLPPREPNTPRQGLVKKRRRRRKQNGPAATTPTVEQQEQPTEALATV